MKLLSLPYYKHLLKQYYKLPLISLCVCLGLSLAFDLSFGSGSVGVIGPMALVVMVVGLSLQMFTPMHHSLELSHLLSLPLSRKQIYTTTLLAGMSLLLGPTLIIGFMTEFEGYYIISYVILMVYYFTLCSFSNLISRRPLTNVLFLLFLTVGLALINILLVVVVHLYSYGGSFDLDFSYLASMIPVISAIEFVARNTWPYAVFHLFEWLLMIGASLVWFEHFKPEQNSNKALVVWLLKPFVYLVIFLLLLWLFNLSFYGYHFNKQYYLRFLLVMVVLGGVSAVLTQMWLSIEGEPIFGKRKMVQSLLYMGLSFALFLIPMRYQDNRPIERVDITNKHYFTVLSFEEHYEPLYQYIRSHPEQFKRDKGDLFISVSKGEWNDEGYYIDVEDMDASFKQVLYQTIQAMPVLPGEEVFVFQDEILDAESYRDYVRSIQEKELPKAYIENISFGSYNEDYGYYAQALTNLSFDDFAKDVKRHVSTYLSQDQLHAIYTKVAENIKTMDTVIERTYYNDIKKGELTVAFDITSNIDQELEDHMLYADYYYTLYYRVTLDEHKQVTKIELTEVI